VERRVIRDQGGWALAQQCVFVSGFAHVYVCMYVCMYVRIHVCMYVCVCMYERTYSCMYVCMYVCPYRTYVCTYLCFFCIYARACAPRVWGVDGIKFCQADPSQLRSVMACERERKRRTGTVHRSGNRVWEVDGGGKNKLRVPFARLPGMTAIALNTAL